MQNNLHLIPTLAVKTIKSGKHELKCLEGTVHLPAWEGFQSRKGPYNSVDANELSDGTIALTVGEYTSANESLSVSEEQVAAYNYLVDEQSSIREAILNALLPAYQRMQPEYGYEDGDDIMPNVTATAQFTALIGLSTVHILDVHKEGIAYTGYEFGCTWDDEHGLGVMMHKDRVIEIDAADTSFDTWIAEKDSDPVRAAEELEKAKKAPVIPFKKPWWKFW
ncbi:DUF6985 domain-containing protein [Flavisolibacter ginsenosidimutans]|uniref:DUF6985 domain-containing protein n=1 Tax=Flavisolibacter ginsenosidimutans TaxID=661481 RepID=A0A5B8UIB7_9BACT|nr:hypothetical protein [Flavisolibacter ginsenosidimutans]QEC56417.1 hypothetical protein FSB75_11110 [Flavisolibacter ginsenosidimutans]